MRDHPTDGAGVRSLRLRAAAFALARAARLACIAPLLQGAAPAPTPSGATRAADQPESNAIKAPWIAAGAWRQPQGLPQNTVISALQTRDGYLWVGTRGGLARFDGVNFAVFDSRDPTQLRENEIWALVEGNDASLWIGTYGGGLSRLKDGRFTVYTKRDGLCDDFVTVLCEDNQHVIWVGTDQGISRFKAGRFVGLSEQDGLPHPAVRALYADREGSMWIGTNRGDLCRYRDGTISTPEIVGPKPDSEIRSIVQARDGALWVSTTDGLFRLQSGKSVRYTIQDGLSSDRIFRAHQDAQGRVWVGTSRGLDQYDQAQRAFHAIDRQLLHSASVIAGDREDNLWVGTTGEGLFRLRQSVFVTYTDADGLASSYGSAILQDRAGTVWVGTNAGLTSFRGGRFTVHGADYGLPTTMITSLAEGADGDLWVGTDVGLFHARRPSTALDKQRRPQFRPVEDSGMPRMHVRIIYEDRQGSLWVGTNLEGLVRYRDRQFREYTTHDGLLSNAIRGISEDDAGHLWIGTRGGLNRLDLTDPVTITPWGGLANDSIEAQYRDRRDSLWLSTRHSLKRLAHGKLVTYSAQSGLYSDFVYSMVEDDDDNMWMSSNKGIFRVSRKDLDDFADGKVETVRSVAFGHEYGLSNTVGTVGFHPGAIRAQDGGLWFGNASGVSVVYPARLKKDDRPPPAKLEVARVDQTTYAPSDRAQAPPGRGDLEFRYTALTFVAPASVRFKYKLDGYDRDWIDAGARRVAYYTNIPPGDYAFTVLAGDSAGLWNDGGASFHFRLAPHFYQTVWFYGACTAAAVLIGAYSQRLRVRRLQKRERDLSARVAEAMADIKILRGLLPVCSACKKIRDDQGYWRQMESYIHEHSQAEFSHGICPDCMLKLYPEYNAASRGRSHT